MAENTAIEWCDHTFNPWTGCTKVGPGCDHCYAEAWAKRSGTVQWGSGEPRRRTTPANWRKPLQWEAGHTDFLTLHNRRQRVFCASLADVFDNEVPVQWRVDLFRLIAATPNLDWLLLTKRIGNAQPMMREVAQRCGGGEQPMENVWLGATVVNQAEADRDIPKLGAVPARVRFLSIEPMLGAIHLGALVYGVDWVICGGESGPGARPMHPDWARDLRDQCAAAGVPFLFKQWGEHTAGELAPHPEHADGAWRLDGRGERWHDPVEGDKPRDQWQPVKFMKVGKKAAARLLDGRTHDEFPAEFIGGAA